MENLETHEILHYVEKPGTFVSTTINCGIYLCSPSILTFLSEIFNKKNQDIYENFVEGDNNLLNGSLLSNINQYEGISWEKDVLTNLSDSKGMFAFHTSKWWSQIKTAGSAIYANRHYLDLYRQTHPNWLTKNSESGPKIVGDVFIHPSASVDPTATVRFYEKQFGINHLKIII